MSHCAGGELSRSEMHEAPRQDVGAQLTGSYQESPAQQRPGAHDHGHQHVVRQHQVPGHDCQLNQQVHQQSYHQQQHRQQQQQHQTQGRDFYRHAAPTKDSHPDTSSPAGRLAARSELHGAVLPSSDSSPHGSDQQRASQQEYGGRRMEHQQAAASGRPESRELYGVGNQPYQTVLRDPQAHSNSVVSDGRQAVGTLTLQKHGDNGTSKHQQPHGNADSGPAELYRTEAHKRPDQLKDLHHHSQPAYRDDLQHSGASTSQYGDDHFPQYVQSSIVTATQKREPPPAEGQLGQGRSSHGAHTKQGLGVATSYGQREQQEWHQKPKVVQSLPSQQQQQQQGYAQNQPGPRQQPQSQIQSHSSDTLQSQSQLLVPGGNSRQQQPAPRHMAQAQSDTQARFSQSGRQDQRSAARTAVQNWQQDGMSSDVQGGMISQDTYSQSDTGPSYRRGGQYDMEAPSSESRPLLDRTSVMEKASFSEQPCSAPVRYAGGTYGEPVPRETMGASHPGDSSVSQGLIERDSFSGRHRHDHEVATTSSTSWSADKSDTPLPQKYICEPQPTAQHKQDTPSSTRDEEAYSGRHAVSESRGWEQASRGNFSVPTSSSGKQLPRNMDARGKVLLQSSSRAHPVDSPSELPQGRSLAQKYGSGSQRKQEYSLNPGNKELGRSSLHLTSQDIPPSRHAVDAATTAHHYNRQSMHDSDVHSDYAHGSASMRHDSSRQPGGHPQLDGPTGTSNVSPSNSAGSRQVLDKARGAYLQDRSVCDKPTVDSYSGAREMPLRNDDISLNSSDPTSSSEKFMATKPLYSLTQEDHQGQSVFPRDPQGYVALQASTGVSDDFFEPRGKVAKQPAPHARMRQEHHQDISGSLRARHQQDVVPHSQTSNWPALDAQTSRVPSAARATPSGFDSGRREEYSRKTSRTQGSVSQQREAELCLKGKVEADTSDPRAKAKSRKTFDYGHSSASDKIGSNTHTMPAMDRTVAEPAPAEHSSDRSDSQYHSDLYQQQQISQSHPPPPLQQHQQRSQPRPLPQQQKLVSRHGQHVPQSHLDGTDLHTHQQGPQVTVQPTLPGSPPLEHPVMSIWPTERGSMNIEQTDPKGRLAAIGRRWPLKQRMEPIEDARRDVASPTDTHIRTASPGHYQSTMQQHYGDERCIPRAEVLFPEELKTQVDERYRTHEVRQLPPSSSPQHFVGSGLTAFEEDLEGQPLYNEEDDVTQPWPQHHKQQDAQRPYSPSDSIAEQWDASPVQHDARAMAHGHPQPEAESPTRDTLEGFGFGDSSMSATDSRHSAIEQIARALFPDAADALAKVGMESKLSELVLSAGM